PHGESGKVIGVRVFSREDGDELPPGVNELVRVYVAQKRKIQDGDKLASRLPDDARAGEPGTRTATPVFDGAREQEIVGLLGSTRPNRDGTRQVAETGKARLFDGRSGEPFPEPISVGYIYILKLLHLVDDKIHARSTGPY